VYRPILARIERSEEDVRAEIPAICPAYTVQPVHEPLDKNVTLRFSLEEGDPLQGAGIYTRNGEGKWEYVSAAVNEGQRLLTASVRGLGTYAVLHDNIAPEISNIRPRQRSTVGTSTPKISARVEDVGSGIDHKAIAARLDGKLIICEYDAFENRISHKVESALASGEHTLSISLSDYAGNASRSDSTFMVP
jgi:hypothetical protein